MVYKYTSEIITRCVEIENNPANTAKEVIIKTKFAGSRVYKEEDDENDKDDEDLVTNKNDEPPGILILNKVDLMDRSKLSEQLPELIQSLATDPKKTNIGG